MFYTMGQKGVSRLTGRTRLRAGWRRRLVLQVEVERPKPNGHIYRGRRSGSAHQRVAPTIDTIDTPYDPWSAGSETSWRDALLTDMSEIDLFKKDR